MKQIQFAIVFLNENEAESKAVRKMVEGPLNNGWELNDWKPVGIIKDESNMSAVSIVVCLTRDVNDSMLARNVSADEEPVVKRGRPAKVEEPELVNA